MRELKWFEHKERVKRLTKRVYFSKKEGTMGRGKLGMIW